MAVLKNRVGVATSTVGAGTITLGAPLTSAQAPNNAAWQSFATGGVANGDIVRYLVLDSNGAWEYGPGTWSSGAGTLTRPATAMNGTIAGQKSSTGSLLVLSGNAQVFITAVAEDIISSSGTITADDVAQWATPTTIKGVPLATWRTDPHFFNILDVKSAAGGDGAALRGLAGQGWVYATGASADISLVLSSQGNGVISFYNGGFGRLCAQFTSAPSGNTFPTFTGNVNFSTLGNNPTGNPIVMTSVLQLLGVTDGSNAAAGKVGEVLTATGSAVSVGAGGTAAVASITLTAGDWDLWGGIFLSGGSPTGAAVQALLSTSSGGLNTTPMFYSTNIVPTSGFVGLCVGPTRINLTSSQTYYINCGNGGSTSISCDGTITARRRR